MASYKLLFCLVLYCLQIATDAKSLNFKTNDVQGDFKEAIENLSRTIEDEVEAALSILEQLEKDVNIVAYIDIYGLSQMLDREDVETFSQLDKIETENNKACIDRARASLTESRATISSVTEQLRKELEDENKIVAAKYKASVREHLKVPDRFLDDFNACSDDDCRRKITESVLHEILVVPEKVNTTLKDAKETLMDLLTVFADKKLTDILNNYRSFSVDIVEGAKKC